MAKKKKSNQGKSNARKRNKLDYIHYCMKLLDLLMIGLAVIIMFEFGPVGRSLHPCQCFFLGIGMVRFLYY